MRKDTIAGNGCGNIDYTATALQNCKATTKQLALYSTELQKAVARLQKAIDRMPVSMYEIVGSEIIEAGKVINDVSCASGSAHDRRKGF
jgi:hypothetical protein